MIHRLEELDPARLERRLAEKPALVLALGTIEWHSHHLPLGLDLLKAQAIAERAADTADAVLAPAAWWAAGGVVRPHTLRLPASATEPVLAAVLDGFAGMGFRAIAIVNGHYGLENSIAVRRAALSVETATVVPLADYEVLTDLGATGDHAGVFETSLLVPVRPELVRLDHEGDLPGVIGEDPRGRASAELGARALELAAERVAAALDRALTEPREPYAAALASATAALERLYHLRENLGRERIPPVQTPAWLRHLEAFREGDWNRARAAAEAKRADPAA
ncbi:MAG TPA: creatininase family protein [Gaiellaceae bacterium]|nr:creatininase family protein [Gaiellaceae bacterium]